MTDAHISDVDTLRLFVRGRMREGWKVPYAESVQRAYRAGNTAVVAELAVVAAAHLEGDGRLGEALTEIEFALDLIGNVDRAARVELEGLQGLFQSYLGDAQKARESVARSRADADATESQRSALEADVFARVVSCVLLDQIEPDRLRETRSAAERSNLNWLASGLKIWAVPYTFARGDALEAETWLNSLELQATALGHGWRMDDATALRRGVRLAVSVEAPDDEPEWRSENHPARRSAAVSQLAWAGSHRGRALDAELEAVRLACEPRAARVRGGVEAFTAWARTRMGDADVVAVEPPGHIGLITLAEVLAAGEAIAAAGTQEQALQWCHRLQSSVPDWVITCLEWPVTIARIAGLLAARAGDFDSSIRLLRRAVSDADRVGLPAESAIARVQLAEILSAAPSAPRRREWVATRDEGRQRSGILGIPYDVHAAIAASAAALARFDGAKPILTPREVEVLACFDRGGTYKTVGAELGLSWQTVQKHAHNAYEKLGVANRQAAIAAAHDLGLL